MADPRLDFDLDRRKLLQYSGAGAAALIFGAGPYTAKAEKGAPRFPAHPFKLGVASGDPHPDGVVLWTRLAPKPLDADPATPGGMPAVTVPVSWEVAEDEHFAHVVKHGTEIARPELSHSVHAEVSGLRPGRDYFYRFRAGGDISPIGRTRTAPAAGSPQSVRFAFVSCQHYEHGYYTAFRHLAEDHPDVVLHLGDAIYEYGPGAYKPLGGAVRKHDSPETTNLAGYRHRHALYRTDADQRAAYAAAPWIVTWDDHEVDNNYADETSEHRDPKAAFRKRRAAAYQAYYENMPLRRASVPRGPDARMYRRLGYGALVDFTMLDTRQYRSDQADGDGIRPPNAGQRDPKRTLTGGAQEKWLIDGMASSHARWKIVAQQVFFGQVDLVPGKKKGYNMDAWDGYTVNRARVLSAIDKRHISNPVVLSGDVHCNWADELKADFTNPKSKTLGVEFVGTSISSDGDGSDQRADTAAILKENPHIKFYNNYRGYVLCTAGPSDFRADYRVVPYVRRRGAPIHTRASFLVENGHPALHKIADNKVPGGNPMLPADESNRIRG